MVFDPFHLYYASPIIALKSTSYTSIKDLILSQRMLKIVVERLAG
jgi:hypothetical protein